MVSGAVGIRAVAGVGADGGRRRSAEVARTRVPRQLPGARPTLGRPWLVRLSARRKSAGSTQTDLARRAGIRPETLRRLEKGKSTPDVKTDDKIIRVLARVEAKASLQRLRRVHFGHHGGNDTTAKSGRSLFPPRLRWAR